MERLSLAGSQKKGEERKVQPPLPLGLFDCFNLPQQAPLPHLRLCRLVRDALGAIGRHGQENVGGERKGRGRAGQERGGQSCGVFEGGRGSRGRGVGQARKPHTQEGRQAGRAGREGPATVPLSAGAAPTLLSSQPNLLPAPWRPAGEAAAGGGGQEARGEAACGRGGVSDGKPGKEEAGRQDHPRQGTRREGGQLSVGRRESSRGDARSLPFAPRSPRHLRRR